MLNILDITSIFFLLKTKCNLLIAHMRPVYPGRHTQVKVLTPSTHVAPFWHGSGLQSSISGNKRYNVFVVIDVAFVVSNGLC